MFFLPSRLSLLASEQVNKRLVVFGPGITEIGGAAKQTLVLIEALAARGWKIIAIGRAGTLRRFRVIRRTNVVLVDIPGFGLRRLGAVLYLLIATPIGLVAGMWAQSFVAVQILSQATAAGIASLVTRRPFIAWPTTSGHLSEVAYVLGTKTAQGRRKLLRRASYVVAQTAVTARELAAIVDEPRIVMIPNPVRRVAVPALSGEPRALYTGRLSEEKDLLLLIEAWRDLLRIRKEAFLTLAGEGGHYRSVEAELRRLVEEDEKLRSSVTFAGWVNDVGSYLETHDVYVFPSRTEGMSNSLTEACAWGRVIVASDIEPNQAVVGNDYPLLFPVGDKPALSEALDKAFSDDELRAAALSKLSRRMMELDAASVAGKWEQLIGRPRRG